MFKPIISKPIIRMAAAACVASAVGFAITASPGAGSPTQDVTAQSYASANPGRLRVPMKGNVCSVHGWPNFETECQFDLREPTGEARTIRVIALR